MQFISNHGAASGCAGGLVASHGRIGAQLRAHTMRRQPRTPGQQNNRALLGSLAAVWRSLSPALRMGWADLAVRAPRRDALGQPFTPSGYALFVSCNRNRLTLGETALLRYAPALPAVPGLGSFSAVPVYTSPTFPRYLTNWLLTLTHDAPFGSVAVLRASPAVSPARGNVRPSEMRILSTLIPWPSYSLAVFDTWTAVYGDPPPSGQVTFELNLVDPVSGFAGPHIRATAPFIATAQSPPFPGQVTIEFDTVPEAVLTGQEVLFNSTPEAGG